MLHATGIAIASAPIIIPLFQQVQRELTAKLQEYGEYHHKEIQAIGVIYQNTLISSQIENPASSLNTGADRANAALPIHLQYDREKRIPLIFHQGFRPESKAAEWKRFIKEGEFSHLIFDMIGYICEYQREREKNATRFCIFSAGFNYDPTNLFFEEMKTWFCFISKYAPYDTELAIEVNKRISYLTQIINKTDVFSEEEKNLVSVPINPQRKQVIVYLKGKLLEMKKMIGLYQSRHSAREQFQKIKVKTKSLIYDTLEFLFYDGSNLQLPENFILSELFQPKINSYLQLTQYTLINLIKTFLNTKLMKQIFSLENDDDIAMFKIINPFSGYNGEVIFPENLSQLNVSIRNWTQSSDQLKSGMLPYFTDTHPDFPVIILKILKNLYDIGNFYLICDMIFELSGDGGDILVYGYMGQRIAACTRHFETIFKGMNDQLSVLSKTTQELSEKINTKQKIPQHQLNNIKFWQVNHEKAYMVWMKLQSHQNEIIDINADIIKKVDVCNSFEYRRLIKQKIEFFDRLSFRFIQHNNQPQPSSLVSTANEQLSLGNSVYAPTITISSAPALPEKNIDSNNADSCFERKDFVTALDLYTALLLNVQNAAIESRHLYCVMVCDEINFANANYAIGSIDQLIAKYREDAEPKRVKARLQKHFNFFKDAKNTLEQILEQNPNDRAALQLKMELLQEMAEAERNKISGMSNSV